MRAAPIALLLLSSMRAPALRAQAFTHVTIRPATSTDIRSPRFQVLPSGDLRARAIPFVELLRLAYDVPDNPSPRVSSLPEWTVTQRFNIEATAPADLKLETQGLEARQRTVHHLLRKLLASQFGLEMSVRTERIAIYGLVVAPAGSRLVGAVRSDCILDTSPDGCRTFTAGFGHPLNGNAVTMSDLAHYLENWTDLPVVDHTGLNGLFRMHSQGWRPMNLPPPPPGAGGSGNEFADLPPLTAILARSGLSLKRQQDTMPFYTIRQLHLPATHSSQAWLHPK